MPTGPHDPGGSRLRDDEDARTVIPATDVFETETGFTIVADMPGVAPERLEVTTEGDALTIRGRVTRASRPPDHREFELADYAQTFTLTDDVDPARIRAALKDGVLRITVPKSATIQPRRIEIDPA